MMKTSFATSAVTLMIGILIGWFARPDFKPEEQASAPVKSRSISPVGSGASARSGARNPDPARPGYEAEAAGHFVLGELNAGTGPLDGETIPEDPMGKVFVDRQRKTHENLLADLARKLNLNEEQKGHLAKVLDERLKDFRLKINEGKAETGEAKIKEMGALIRGEGVREVLAGFLNDEQLAAYDTHKKKEWSRHVESRAYKNLAKINGVLELSDAQKDQVYEVLYEDAGEKMEANQDVQAFMGMFSGYSGTEIDVGDGGMGDMMQFALMSESEGEIDPKETMQQMQEQRATQNEEKLERLNPILDELQLERYREHLESSTPLFQQMMQEVELDRDFIEGK